MEVYVCTTLLQKHKTKHRREMKQQNTLLNTIHVHSYNKTDVMTIINGIVMIQSVN